MVLPHWPVTDLKIFGREEEVALLDAAWNENKLSIMVLVAAGGVGKTALVNHWIFERMQVENWRDAERVYALSFYSQGTSEDRQASADIVIEEALRWFGYKQTSDSPMDAYNKGYKLAELVREKRTLLLLDGLEPLQDPTGAISGHPGRVNDLALKGLLRGLATENPSLCVVSTRVTVADLKPFAKIGRLVHSKNLDDLTPETGAAYLKSIGVKIGSVKDFREASEAFGNHALALTLLGHYLVEHRDCDVRRRDEIPDLFHDEEKGGHAMRVMKWYADEFEDTPEGELLYILGLFDRPAERGAIDALRSGDPIENLTTRLNGLSPEDWNTTLKTLRRLRLISEKTTLSPIEDDVGEEEIVLDCHPLMREYFGKRLEKDLPEAWKAANDRLYNYYKDLPEKDLPDTIEEMAPLFQAVAHGCRAGRHQEAYNDVYRRRIDRGQAFYSTNILGAFGADLSALAGFFEPPWRRPVEDLAEGVRAFILAQAAFRLRALGRLDEAVSPTQASLKLSVVREDWHNAAIQAGNLSELSLTLGRVPQAVHFAEQAVRYADDSQVAFQRFVKRSTLADALHQAGRLDRARDTFREAETMQKDHQPQFPFLYSIRGFKNCDLILAQGDVADAQRRASQTLEWATLAGKDVLSSALDHLTLGRAGLAIVVKAGPRDLAEAENHLNMAVDGLRLAGNQTEIPHGLLARAELYRVQGDFAHAQQDLEEAWEIAMRGGMRLFICDTHLECARVLIAMDTANETFNPSKLAPDSPFMLFLDDPDADKIPNIHAARAHLEAARQLVEDTGYHRRDPEVKELTASLKKLG